MKKTLTTVFLGFSLFVSLPAMAEQQKPNWALSNFPQPTNQLENWRADRCPGGQMYYWERILEAPTGAPSSLVISAFGGCPMGPLGVVVDADGTVLEEASAPAAAPAAPAPSWI